MTTEGDSHPKIQQFWLDSEASLIEPATATPDEDLYGGDVSLGMVIGTFAAVPYIHLQLEARKRLYPDIPLLVHDDCSGRTKQLSALCEQYGVAFEKNSQRMPHHLGDLTAFVGGLRWAKHHGLDLLLKISRRWIFLVDWTSNLKQLALESQYATFSNFTTSYGFGFRTECVGLSVKKWAAQSFYCDVAQKIKHGQHVFVESYIHQFAITHERTASNPRALAWRKQNPTSTGRIGYAAWQFMGTDRNKKEQTRLWHNSDRPIAFATLASIWGLNYSERDFVDPNQRKGIGESPKGAIELRTPTKVKLSEKKIFHIAKHRPALAIITSLGRSIYLSTLVDSFRQLQDYFKVDWYPYMLDHKNKISIGSAWNESIKKIVDQDSWCIILDDDNMIHPDFGKSFSSGIQSNSDVQIFLFRQFLKNGGKRFTFDPQLRNGSIDAAQIGFRLQVAQKIPFPDTNNAPDGEWAEAIKSNWKGPIIQLDVPTYYNYFR